MRRRVLFGDIVFALFILVQVLDGALTYAGIHHFGIGIDIEGNPLLRVAMASLGVRMALLFVKLAAILFGSFIHFHKYHKILAALTAFYVVAAIFPWVVLLSGYFFT